MSRLKILPGIALRLIDAGVARVYKSLMDLHRCYVASEQISRPHHLWT